MILVTGASGFVGQSLVFRMLTDNLKVRVCVRSGSFFLSQKVNVVQAHSISGNTSWYDTLKDVKVIIHLAARVHIMNDKTSNSLDEFRKVNVEGTLNLARQAAEAGVKRFIFVSSVKVNGEHTALDRSFTESDDTYPQDAYGLSKMEAEQGLLGIAKQTGMQVVIIRPPLVYGAGVKANFLSMMLAVKRGIPLPLGDICNKRSFVYVGNLVSLIMCCIDHPAAANQVFLVSDGHDLSTTELLKECAAALGVKSRLLPVPQKIIEIGASLIGKKNVSQRLYSNLQVDITKARELLDWEPPYTLADGLKATAEGLFL